MAVRSVVKARYGCNPLFTAQLLLPNCDFTLRRAVQNDQTVDRIDSSSFNCPIHSKRPKVMLELPGCPQQAGGHSLCHIVTFTMNKSPRNDPRCRDLFFRRADFTIPRLRALVLRRDLLSHGRLSVQQSRPSFPEANVPTRPYHTPLRYQAFLAVVS